MKKRKLSIILLSILSLSVILQACGNTSKTTINSNTEVTQQSKPSEDKPTEINKQTLSNYKELTDFGKEKISDFSELMKKYNIESVITPDNMYIVNKEKTYKKYNNDYKFSIEYMMNPNFKAGQGAGVATLFYEKHIDDKFSADDDKLKLINDVVNSFTDENMSVDDFANKLNDADDKAKTSKKFTEDFDKNHKIYLTINYDNNKTQLMLKHVDAFDNYKIDNTKPNSYNTVAEFVDGANSMDKRAKEIQDFLTGNGFNGVFYNPQDNKGKDYVEVKYYAYANSDKFTEEYVVSGNIYNYDIKNPQSNNTLKSLYKFLTKYTLNETLSETEFYNYINSYMIYRQYKPSIEYSKINEGDSDDRLYYLPFANIKEIQNNKSLGYYFNASYYDGIDKKDGITNLPSMEFQMHFELPVIAEGKTRS